MSKCLNKLTIIGYLGNDPKAVDNYRNILITKISVATTETWKGKNGEGKKSETEWHNVTFFNALAGIAKKFLRKGARVYVEGKIKTNKWEDRDGFKRYRTEVIGSNLIMLDSKKESEAKPNGEDKSNDYNPDDYSDYNEKEDDIPF